MFDSIRCSAWCMAIDNKEKIGGFVRVITIILEPTVRSAVRAD